MINITNYTFENNFVSTCEIPSDLLQVQTLFEYSLVVSLIFIIIYLFIVRTISFDKEWKRIAFRLLVMVGMFISIAISINLFFYL